MVVTYTRIGNSLNSQSDKIEDSKTKWALALHSFNPVVNLQKLFTVKESGDKALNVLNGVRVLSICWIILSHSFVFVSMTAITNGQTLNVLSKNEFFSLIPGGEFAVDSFFFLSAFLTFYILICKLYPKKGNIGIINTIVLYFHRYYRLIFPLLFIELFSMYLLRYLGNGPIYR